MARTTIEAWLVGMAAVLTAAGCEAAKLSPGDAAPAWAGIVGTDDKPHGLADYAAAKLIVLVFTCNQCPVAQGYEDRLLALQQDYRAKGVQVVAVNVNNNSADRLEPMKKRAAEKKFNFPYLYDPTQKMGRDYGATQTPHVFVLGGDRAIAYVGAIDDNLDVKGVKEHYLRDALDALLAGNKPAKAVTQQFGCGIQYEAEKK
jgi:peroxiredoxin